MTISYNTSTINSLSTDVKPTNVPTGIICNETDTLKIFIFNGSTWDELTRQTNTDNKEPLLPSMTGNTLKVLRVNAGETAKEWATISGAGEVNTSSNQGVGGVGVVLAKSGVDLPFKSINTGSAKITITDDVVNKEIDVDVVTGTTVNSVCIGNDSRLSDARTPLAHTHPESDITNLTTDLAGKFSSTNRQTAIVTSEISNNQITIPKLHTIGESVEANSAHTLTAANMVTNSILTCTPTVARIFTSDTAANLIALIGSVVGNWFEFTIVSKAAFTITLATATGLTLSGNLVCAASSSATFIGIVTSGTTVSIFRK